MQYIDNRFAEQPTAEAKRIGLDPRASPQAGIANAGVPSHPPRAREPAPPATGEGNRGAINALRRRPHADSD